MKRIPTSKSPEQILAEFERAFRDVKPDKTAREAAWLEPYRKALMRQRKRGLSWDQIAGVMGQPPISEKVTAEQLRRVFAAELAQPKRTRVPVADDRFVLDPVTGREVPPSALPR